MIYYRWLFNPRPTVVPRYTVYRHHDEFEIYVYPTTPDLDRTSVRYKYGPVATTDCNRDDDYQSANPALPSISILYPGQPLQMCLKGNNTAGLPTPIAAFTLTDN